MAIYGFVYVMSNGIMPNVYKIGYTNMSPRKRAQDLSNTSVPTPYEIVVYGEIESPMWHEKTLHRMFEHKKVTGNREFFNLDDNDLLKIYQYLDEKSFGTQVNYPLDVILEGLTVMGNVNETYA